MGDGNAYLLAGRLTGLSDTTPGHGQSGIRNDGHRAWRGCAVRDYVIRVNSSVTKGYRACRGTGTTTTLVDAPAIVCVATIGDYVVIGQGAGDLSGFYLWLQRSRTNWDFATSTATLLSPCLRAARSWGWLAVNTGSFSGAADWFE